MGAQGPKGATGAQGPQGVAGVAGATGGIGATGPGGWITGGASGEQDVHLDNNHLNIYYPITGVGQNGGYYSESLASQPMGSAAKLVHFTVVLEKDPGNGKGFHVSVNKNGVAVATATVLSSGANSIPLSATWTGSATFSAGDLIDIAVTGVNNPGGSSLSWRMTFSQ